MRIKEILRCGYLRPTLGGGSSGETDPRLLREKKIVWFSANDHWEPMAYRGWQDLRTGIIRDLHTREENAEKCGGLYRIGVKPEKVKPWFRLKKLAHIHPEMAHGLENIAYEHGANPFDWWGTIFPVTVDQWESVQVLKDEVWTELLTVQP